MSEMHIRLIAPSGYPHDRAAMARGVERLQAAGCRVDGLDVLERTELRYAGGDAQRVADLNALATCEQLPDIALSIRGGYGATRLLEYIDYAALRERLSGTNTVLVGHSDFTALQMALHARSGLVTFGGPMLGPDFGAAAFSDFTWQHFWQTVAAPQATASWSAGGETELDRGLLEAVKDPLTHLVRNAVDHGIEPADERVAAGKPAKGLLSLQAYHAGGLVTIEVADDGRGIDPDKIVGLDLVMPDAVTLKFISAPLTDAQIKEMIQIPPK